MIQSEKTPIVNLGNALIIGLGYVGFPLLLEAAAAGYRVYGLDSNNSKIEGYKNGKSQEEYYDKSIVYSLISSGRISFHDSTKDLKVNFDVIIICVPTPLTSTGIPDLTFIISSMDSVVKLYRDETLVVLESSSYPGTTRSLVYERILSEFPKSATENNTLVAYSPERIDPGSKKWNLRNTSKLVSGITPRSQKRALHFYSNFVDRVVPVSSVEDAELAKLFENTFRLVNISLVNEFVAKLRFSGCNPKLALEAAFTKPFGIMEFRPSPGIGGHCIPVDPVYLLDWAQKIGIDLTLIEAANNFSKSQPGQNAKYIENKIGSGLQGKKILIVGVSYKADVADTRESPALALIHELEKREAEVSWYDPIASIGGPKRVKLMEWQGDVVVLVTKHSFIDINQIKAAAPIFIDLNR